MPDSDRPSVLRPLAVDGDVEFVDIDDPALAQQAAEVFATQWDYVHGYVDAAALADLPAHGGGAAGGARPAGSGRAGPDRLVRHRGAVPGAVRMTACAVCGRVGRWQHHHLTGRDHTGSYLDPDLTVPLCHDHHTLCDDDLAHPRQPHPGCGAHPDRTGRVAAPPQPPPDSRASPPTVTAIRSLACSPQCWSGGRTSWPAFAAISTRCLPDWRLDRGFYPAAP